MREQLGMLRILGQELGHSCDQGARGGEGGVEKAISKQQTNSSLKRRRTGATEKGAGRPGDPPAPGEEKEGAFQAQ